MKLGVISDTHGYLNPRVFDIFADVDFILHAGDIGEDRILTDLEALAPVFAVSGNVDGMPRPWRPQKYCGDFQGVRICMTHGHLLDTTNYNASALHFFEEEKPRIVIHGHSHRAKNETRDGVLFINPGSAGRPRFRDIPSVAVIEITTAEQIVCRFVSLQPPQKQV